MEFLAVSLNSSQVLAQDRLLAVFKTFDTDSGGTVTIDEIEKMVMQLSAAGREGMEQVMQQVKTEAGDGALLEPIDFEQFVEIMTLPPEAAGAWWLAARRKAHRLLNIGGEQGVKGAEDVKDIDLSGHMSQSVYT